MKIFRQSAYFTILAFVIFLINQDLYSQEEQLITRINEYRHEKGLISLVIEEKLNETANLYAMQLLDNGKLSHIDQNGGRVLDRYRKRGGTAVEAGEILGSSTDLSLILEAWKESPSHNKLMLNSKWLRIGSSVIERNGNIVAVALFSVSQLNTVEYERVSGYVNVAITGIGRRELIFPSDLNIVANLSDTMYRENYTLQIQEEKLPLIIPVFGEIEGRKKMTDFLYIR